MGDARVSLARPQEPSLPVWPGPAAVRWVRFCVCAPGARTGAGVELPCGPPRQPMQMSKRPQRAALPGRPWVGFLVVWAKQACCPLPWSRVREGQPGGPHKHSMGDHERGWAPAGDLRAGARGDSSQALVLRRTPAARMLALLRGENPGGIFRELPDQCVTPRKVSTP